MKPVETVAISGCGACAAIRLTARFYSPAAIIMIIGNVDEMKPNDFKPVNYDISLSRLQAELRAFEGEC
jgi:hypothetical protein